MLPQVFLPAIYCSWYEKWSCYTPYLCFNVWRTNNATESFHAHYNAQFNGDHPNIYIFFDVIQKQQSLSYVKLLSTNSAAPECKIDKERAEYKKA